MNHTTSSQRPHAPLLRDSAGYPPLPQGNTTFLPLPLQKNTTHGAPKLIMKPPTWRKQRVTPTKKKTTLTLPWAGLEVLGRTAVQPEQQRLLSFQPAFQRTSWSPKASAPWNCGEKADNTGDSLAMAPRTFSLGFRLRGLI